MTENQEAELFREWRLAKNKDENTIELLAQLYDVSIEEVKEIMAKERSKPFKWTDERVHRLKAYIRQGLGNTAIANQLGCNAQSVADYKKTHKNELCCFDKKKEPSTVGTAESSKKNTITEINSSTDDYNIKTQESQEVSEETLWNERYMELHHIQSEALSILYESEAYLTAATDAGSLWGCVANAEKLQNYIEMYRVLCERALECISKAVEVMENV